MILGPQADKLPTNLTISGLNIELVNQFKLLGVIVMDTLEMGRAYWLNLQQN